MLYTIIITNENGAKKTYHITAENISAAHEKAEKLTTEGDTVKAYATTQEPNGDIVVDGINDGALTVVKRTTAHMINREGGNIQFKLYNECRRPVITDHDVLDCLSVTRLAILDAMADGDPIDAQYRRAYKALNRHLRANKQINLSATAQRTEYIEDLNGDIINVNGDINIILKDGEKYNPAPTVHADAEKRAADIAIIRYIAAHLTPTQIKVFSLLADGLTLRQIAEELNRSAPTVQVHINKIRAIASELYPNYNDR